MIYRKEYRACLKEEIGSLKSGAQAEAFRAACAQAEAAVKQLVRDGVLLTASVYTHGKLCFLYCEALKPDAAPEDFLAALAPWLELWPEEKGLTPWAPMYAIYWHSVPGSVEDWERARQLTTPDAAGTAELPERCAQTGEANLSGKAGAKLEAKCGQSPVSGQAVVEKAEKKTRIGRIAFVYPEKLFSYTYWHQAIVQEGLLKGDQYQFISLHENILFSYFEEPKHFVNIRNSDEASKVIDAWTAVDPESHFDREKAGGSNFVIIEPLISVGRSDVR